MKNNLLLYLAIPALGMLFACEKNRPSDLTAHTLVPLPREVVADGELFTITKRTRIVFSDSSLEKHAASMAEIVAEVSDLELKEAPSRKNIKNNRIRLMIEPGTHGNEAYSIHIRKKNMTIAAAHPEGIFRGIVTLSQLLRTGEENMVVENKSIMVPTGQINDWPEYTYRGTMLDVSRHFFGPETVKRYMDLLVLYKINHLHLHLSDDQGWRIEIKSWPKLTETGGSTQVGGGPGGFYTQEEYRDLVTYAAERYITIVPEIDMPGHTNAALASYAELNCDGKATALYTGTRVGFSTLCTDKEITYQFVDDVVREICAMTPGPYFHVGGDESHVTALPDYIYFINRVRDIVHTYGKKMIGWDEVSHADLTQGDIAQYWASAQNARRAVDKGAGIIVSPAKYCYLDMKYDSTSSLGLNWAGYIEVDDAYNWSPTSLVDGIGKEQILGVESPLWSETIETFDDITYLAFPRLIGHAEIGWSDPASRSWEDFRERLKSHGALLDAMGVKYYRSPRVW